MSVSSHRRGTFVLAALAQQSSAGATGTGNRVEPGKVPQPTPTGKLGDADKLTSALEFSPRSACQSRTAWLFQAWRGSLPAGGTHLSLGKGWVTVT